MAILNNSSRGREQARLASWTKLTDISFIATAKLIKNVYSDCANHLYNSTTFYSVINCYSRVIVAFNVMSKIAPADWAFENVFSCVQMCFLFLGFLASSPLSCELSSKSPNPTLSMSATFMTPVARPEQDIKYGWTYHSEKDCQRGDRGHTG
jgi:hypothetical protein